MRITIAGASGFVGQKLINEIDSSFKIRALARSDGRNDSEQIEWLKCDLFSYQKTKSALKDTDIAIFLVHSMLPSSKLFQGNFRDTDLLLADNFARSCVDNNVKQIIYLGGLVPIGESSEHLKARLEVEEVFRETKIATTVLRAGMVVGDGGSSFEILRNLVNNLPMMILPKWTKSNTQLIYIDDLIRVLIHTLNNENFYNRIINVVNGEDVTYGQLIRKTAKSLEFNQPMISVPINYLKLSKWWVHLFGQAPMELVSPLIDSLKCHLPILDIEEDIDELVKVRTYDDMLKRLRFDKRKNRRKSNHEESNVRSIQRLANINQLPVNEIAKEYMEWLPRFIKNIIHVEQRENYIYFRMLLLKAPLLKLEKIENHSILDRVKFHIVGGILSKTRGTGWLEFRTIANRKYTIVSINDFVPSLPWYIYRYTQALVHLYVMKSFDKHLNRASLKK